jgi:hypothetical protein
MLKLLHHGGGFSPPPRLKSTVDSDPPIPMLSAKHFLFTPVALQFASQEQASKQLAGDLTRASWHPRDTLTLVAPRARPLTEQ